jgi:hypothetical protein
VEVVKKKFLDQYQIKMKIFLIACNKFNC